VTVYEVFRQERKGQPFAHAGAIAAPDATFAEAYAREQYGRRGESVALWVVPRDSVLQIEEFVDELHNTTGRYPLKEAEGGRASGNGLIGQQHFHGKVLSHLNCCPIADD
jgi:phenylacetate-CoA oxygenase PaaH subunit